MSDVRKECLLAEARMQMKALHRLGVWKRAALSLVVIGVILMYTGIGGEGNGNILREVFGFIFAVSAGGAALLIHIGQKHGKRNVEHILEAAEG